MLVGMELRHPNADRKSTLVLRSGSLRWRSGVLLAALVTLGTGLAACGGGSPRASSSSGCSPSGCSSPAASASVEATAVKFSGCIRSHGVPAFPDPTIGSNGLPTWAPSPNKHANTDSPAGRAAQQACQKDLPHLGPQTFLRQGGGECRGAQVRRVHAIQRRAQLSRSQRPRTDPDQQRDRHPRRQLARVPDGSDGV